MRWDVAVVGAGAAGLLAACRAAERGRRTLLLEKNRKPGVKILMSGGTRCNLTHATDRRGIVEAYGPPGKFLHSALAVLGPAELVALFEAEGVRTKTEETGKIFPASDKATDVLAALRRRLDRSGATLALDEPLLRLERIDDRFRLVTSRRTVQADKVIVTTGGQSYPGSGTTGDGYEWARQLGHTIVPPRPALVPLHVQVPWVAPLKGITLADVGVRVVDPHEKNGRPLAAARGSFLFTHFGLSGPVVLNVSRAVSGHPTPGRLLLECDFLPDEKRESFDAWLRNEAAAGGKKQLVVILAGKLPRRLAETLLELAEIPAERRGADFGKGERARLVSAIKNLAVPIAGTLGFKKAEVTAGGIDLSEVDSRTMQSKLVPNLFLAGEVLDLDGPIGGYNFQAAFSTGWLAGENV